jgi:integrase
MSRRDYGDGSYIERSPDRWLITVPLGTDAKGNRRRQRFTVKGNKAAAKKALTAALAKRDNGRGVAPDRITTGDWLTRWLTRHIAEGHLSGKTQERYSGIVSKHLIPGIGHVRLQVLRADHVSDLKGRWLSGEDSTAAAPLSGGSVHKHLGVLSQALDDAVKARVITRNPCDAVSAPSTKARSERRALTGAEITILIEAAAGTRYDVPIRFTLATGLREGELLGLRWEDVDLDGAAVEVRRTASYVGGKTVFGAPKTERSRRTIELSAATVQLLRAHRAAQVEHRLRIGPVWREHGLVFPSPAGNPWLARTFYADYRALLAKTAIVDVAAVNWHGLRHSAATQWIAHGVDIFSVSRRLGHASASFTMDVYGHLLKGQQRHASEALDYLLTKT